MATVESKKKTKEKKKPPVERVDEKLLLDPGKYELSENDTFKIEFSATKKQNRWIITEMVGRGAQWVEFKMWTFNEEIELRKMSTTFDMSKRMHLIDHDILNRLKIQRLMTSWSFEEDNPRLKLLHLNGILSDEGWEAFTRLHPNISRYIIEQMNTILEYNQ